MLASGRLCCFMDDFAVVNEATLESMEESLRRRVRRACAAASVSFSPMVGGVCVCVGWRWCGVVWQLVVVVGG